MGQQSVVDGSLASISFYAGAQLVTPRGISIGTLCVWNDGPMDFDRERQQLEQLTSSPVSSSCIETRSTPATTRPRPATSSTSGCRGVISKKGIPLQAGKRWGIERTNSWHNRGFKKLATCTERSPRVIEAFIALANAVIITRRLLAEDWLTHLWDHRPARRP